MSNTVRNFIKIFGLVVALGSFAGLSAYLFNYYTFWAEAQSYVDNRREQVALEETQPAEPVTPTLQELSNQQDQRLLPAQNLDLPEQDRVIIKKLGVNAPIFGGEDSESALRKGAWIAPGFKTPSGNALLERPEPVIISSHLYGYDEWSEEFRNQVSFSGLDLLESGDEIKIIWQQREYVYVVEDGEVSNEIGRYDTDLIIYTCVDLLGSDQRTILYANLDTTRI